MPRRPRLRLPDIPLHIIQRGNDRSVCFYDEADFLFYLDWLALAARDTDCAVHAYCLMSNHIHLLMKEGAEELGTVFKRLGAGYVYWYNWKYNRRGHLFQDRFKSKPDEDDAYLLTVDRYIHQNPVRSGLVALEEEYLYSSARNYAGLSNVLEIDEIDYFVGNKQPRTPR